MNNNNNVKDREAQKFNNEDVLKINRLLHELITTHTLTKSFVNYNLPTKPLKLSNNITDSDSFYIMEYVMTLIHNAQSILNTLHTKYNENFTYSIECHKDTIMNGKTFYEVTANFAGSTVAQYEYDYIDCLSILIRHANREITSGKLLP